jgi:hypothetical protein
VNLSPGNDEAKITVFVHEQRLTMVVKHLLEVFPTAYKIGSNERPIMSRTINALIFYTSADNYLRRAFCAKREDVLQALPQLQIDYDPRKFFKRRRNTVSFVGLNLPPPSPIDVRQSARGRLETTQQEETEEEEGSIVIKVSSSEEDSSSCIF